MPDPFRSRLTGWLVGPDPAAGVRPMEAETTGAGTTTVLLLHGQPGTAGDWEWVTPHLLDRYRVIAPDRPGYGRTAGPSTDFSGNAGAAVELLDRLGHERAVVVGHSWGGGVALALAATYPERVSGLVLVSSIGPGEQWHWDDRLLAAPVLGELIAASTIGGLGLLLGRSRVQRLANRRLAGRSRDAFTALSRLTGDHAPVWRSFVAEQRIAIAEVDDLGPKLSKIATPTAVVHGEGDHLVESSVARRLQSAIAGATLHLVPRVGHLIPHDRPEAVASAVDEVVSRG